MLQAERLRISRRDEVMEFLSIFLIRPAELGAEIYSASNINEY
jgi:hypothetical protein